MTQNAHFKRNQIEEALWSAAFARSFRVPATPLSQTFKTRIKRLLEIDKTLVAGQGFAFIGESPGGQGHEQLFSVWNTCMLGVALELLNAGFAQQDSVFLLKHIRPALNAAFKHALEYPTWDRNIHLQKNVINAPEDPAHPGSADLRIFVALSKLDLKEIYSELPTNIPLITQPRVLYGQKSLNEFLATETYYEPHIIILEIGAMTTCIRDALNKSAPVNRGRKPEGDKSE